MSWQENADEHKARIGIPEILAAFPGRPFAVIGGGLYDDLSALFRQKRLLARSLFLDTRADLEFEKAGPWLVALDQEPLAIDKVLQIAGDKPTIVFWSCVGGEAVIYNHLRSLNIARIPDWAANGEAKAADARTPDRYDLVTFRHWDARVLGALLPILEESQFSRIMGPAEEIAFYAPDHGGVKRVVADENWSAARPGPLTIISNQFCALNETLVALSQKRISRYLRICAPGQTSHLDERQLHSAVANYHAEAQDLGAKNEGAIGLWSYMQVTNRIDLSRDKHVNVFMSDPANGASADQRIRALFDLRSDLLKKG